MFALKPENVRRVVFSSRLFPRLKLATGLDVSKLKSTDKFDGEVFCGGRSKNKDLLSFFNIIVADPSNNLASFTQLPLFRRSIKKLTDIIENELELIGGQQVLMPTIIPEKLWHDSQRLDRQKDALESVFRLNDKEGNKLLLGPTFEETITKLIADSPNIFDSDLPLLLYQTSTKFRYEPNPRFGLLRSYEFLMNDLYSFDSSLEQAKETYQTVGNVYEKIFKILGLDRRIKKIVSKTGDIGGVYSHEYQLPVSSGEDSIVECKDCQYSVNLELLLGDNDGGGAGTGTGSNNNPKRGEKCPKCNGNNVEQFKALELGHTFLLSRTYSQPFDAKFSRSRPEDHGKEKELRGLIEMGCYGLGLSRIVGAGIDLLSIVPKRDTEASSKEIVQLRWPNGIEPFKLGIVTPARRSNAYNAGSSEFIERLVDKIINSTKNVDIIIDDKEKEGIRGKISRLQSLGVPNIIVVGQKFLESKQEVEFLMLDMENKRDYKEHLFSDDQVCDYVKQRLDNQ